MRFFSFFSPILCLVMRNSHSARRAVRCAAVTDWLYTLCDTDTPPLLTRGRANNKMRTTITFYNISRKDDKDLNLSLQELLIFWSGMASVTGIGELKSFWFFPIFVRIIRLVRMYCGLANSLGCRTEVYGLLYISLFIETQLGEEPLHPSVYAVSVVKNDIPKY